MKRGSSGISAVIGIDKPVGMSSHDVVNRCRTMFGEKRVGHMGTLDPLASGVLPVGIGPATRLDAYLAGHDKVYRAAIRFGRSTTTDDAEGETLSSRPVPAEVGEVTFATAVLEKFRGPQMQVPPTYSAIKVGGKKCCDQARKGIELEVEPRPIEVYVLELEDILAGVDEEGRDYTEWICRANVSKGTYIRSLARDIGTAAGSAAHLSSLRRMSVGTLGVWSCNTLEEVARLGVDVALDPVALLGFPVCEVSGAQALTVENGGRIAVDAGAYRAGELVSIVLDNRLKGIYRCADDGAMLVPDCLFATGVVRG